MTTRYRRIGVIRDPELDRALRRTQASLPPSETSSAAAQVRALALRGAETVRDESPAAEARRMLRERHGAIPAERDLLSVLPPLDEVDAGDPTPMTDALDWVRGKDREH